MTKKMQEVESIKIIKLDKNSEDYKNVMAKFLTSEIENNGLELGNIIFKEVSNEYINGTRTDYIFNDGYEKNLIQLNFLSPTFNKKEGGEYSNHIQNWSIFACEEKDNMNQGHYILIQSIEIHTFCMHEEGH